MLRWATLLLLHLTTLILADPVQQTPGRYLWGEWSDWTGCSERCGQGVVNRTRHCNHIHTYTTTSDVQNCGEYGGHMQYKLCTLQECRHGRYGRRSDMCAEFNSREFSGKRYSWVVYERYNKPCVLACKTRHVGYYQRHPSPIPDGTPCTATSPDVCINSTCQTVGCDGVVGSKVKADKCGVCAGDGKSCRVVNGLYTRPHVRRGYTHIVTIPKGAWGINVTENSRSRNYLAVRIVDGPYLFNGHWRLSHTKTYHHGATSVTYGRRLGRHCPAQCLSVVKPTDHALQLQLLSVSTNPGITYRYIVPASTPVYTTLPHFTLPKTARQTTHIKPPQDSTITISRDHRKSRKRKHRTKKLHDVTYNSRYTDYKKYNERVNQRKRTETQRINSPTNNKQRTNPDIANARRTNDEKSKDSSTNGKSSKRENTFDIVNDGSGSAKRNNPRDNVNQKRDGFEAAAGVSASRSYRPRSRDRSARITSRDRSNRIASRDRRIRTKVISRNGLTPRDIGTPLHGGTLPLQAPRDRDKSRDIVIPRDRDRSKNAKSRRHKYLWKVSGLTKCSKTCGGGIQRTRILCVDSHSRAIVTNENCDVTRKPDTPSLICNNIPCPAGWSHGRWSDCNSFCGPGIQNRTVLCEQVVLASVVIRVDYRKCDRSSRPRSRQRCDSGPCARWRSGKWSNCSAECGHGQRRRRVDCVDPKDDIIDEDKCLLLSTKPEVTNVCDMGSCAKAWFHTTWSKACSADCGRGHVTRNVFCSADDGTSLPGARCPGKKPAPKKVCKTGKPCGGRWFTGQWSSCSATCKPAQRIRDVVCIKQLHPGFFTVVTDVNCENQVKPEMTQDCRKLAKCPPTWYMTHWSNCSEECDTGYKTREVSCLDLTLTPSLTCPPKSRPITRRSCNTHSCSNNVQLDKDPSCSDTDATFCAVVVQARMCKYPYYRSQCCRMCARAT